MLTFWIAIENLLRSNWRHYCKQGAPFSEDGNAFDGRGFGNRVLKCCDTTFDQKNIIYDAVYSLSVSSGKMKPDNISIHRYRHMLMCEHRFLFCLDKGKHRFLYCLDKRNFKKQPNPSFLKLDIIYYDMTASDIFNLNSSFSWGFKLIMC